MYLFTIVAMAIGVLVFAGPATPANAVTCYGDYCSGKDPAATGCDSGAVTTKVYNTSIASLQVRWSPTCKTNWTRLIIYPTGKRCVTMGTIKSIQQGTSYTTTKRHPDVCNTYSERSYWTPMIYSPVKKVKGRYESSDWATVPIETGWS